MRKEGIYTLLETLSFNKIILILKNDKIFIRKLCVKIFLYSCNMEK